MIKKLLKLARNLLINSIYKAPLGNSFKIWIVRAILGKIQAAVVFRTEPGFCLVEDNDYKLYFYTPERAQRYYGGVQSTLDSLLARHLPGRFDVLQDAIVIDVGAKIGEFSIAALSRGAEKAIAFEPDGLAFDCLKKNAEMYNYEPKNNLLSSCDTSVKFSPPSATEDSSVTGSRHGKKQNNYRKYFRLDDLISIDTFHGKPVVLKVEAEGGELEVLEGAGDILDYENAFVTVRASCVCEGKFSLDECVSILRKAGLEVSILEDGVQVFAHRKPRNI